MNTNLKKQFKNIDPSVPDALYRRLLREDNLGYLRDDDVIIGFEVEPDSPVELSGFVMIALQKHTILCYRSDESQPDRLILFPSMDKLFNDTYELLNLKVKKIAITDNSFRGRVLEEGLLRNVVSDLTPPQKQVDLPAGMTEAMLRAMLDANDEQLPDEREELDDFNDFNNEPDFDELDEFSEEPDFEDELPTPILTEDPRSTMIKLQKFEELTEVGEYAVSELGVDRNIVNQLISGALRVNNSTEQRIKVAVALFCKIFDDGRV